VRDVPFDMMSLDSVPRHLRFLVIEDDDLNSLIMRTSIETGFHKLLGGAVATTTTHAKNGEEAMRLIGDGSSCAYDVVVCDQHMEASGGEMKGTDVVSALRALKFQSRPPVAVLASGNTGEAEIVTYRECGADIVWPKPYPSALQIARDIVAQLHKREQPTLPPATPAVETEQPKPARSLRSAFDMLRTIIPDVPSEEYDASRRKIVAKRDVGLVRAICCVGVIVRMITPSQGYLVRASVRAQSTRLVVTALDFVLLWWAWNPKRWRRLAQLANAFLLCYFGFIIFEAARGACDDPTDAITRCIAYRAHLIDPVSMSIYYVVNVLIFLWGGLRFRSHMRTVAVEAVLIVAGAFQNGCHGSMILDTVFIVTAIFGIALCVERKRRFHFLEGVLREQACMQQQTLVTLLWCVPLSLVRWRLCLRCLTLPVLAPPPAAARSRIL
jgi:CheY-like chemotaxis protein